LQFRATGGGAYKFGDLFKERLGVTLKKEDEISCLVAGCNFLLRAIWHEAFEFRDNECHFMSHFSGVSILLPVPIPTKSK
jgi:type II pantothenate kinase